ncbi:hypothetical protein ACFQ7N_36835 [Streptomyces niveus]|uniref:hypothetical protein n=1 Tax=Streptomyces niveus TaxID=193462 RepID=UPI00369EABC6
MSTSPNDATAALLAARTSGLRVITSDGRGIPVAHEPRDAADREPWAEYNARTGTVIRRHSSASCTTVQTTARWMQWSVSRSVSARLTRAGVHCAYEGRADGTRATTTFVDGSSLTWTGAGIRADVQGDDFTIHHSISEHRILRVQCTDDDGDITEQQTFATGNYADDSAALVACVTAYADRHGRTPRAEEPLPPIVLEGDPVSATLLKARSQEKGAVRIVTNDDRMLPVAYEPRTSDDPTPWAEYDPADGTVVGRRRSLECATLDVERGTVTEGWTVARSIYARLEEAGIEFAFGNDSGGTYIRVALADGSELTWNGVTVHGNDVSVLHTIGEHRSFVLDFTGRDGREVNHQFATGSYAADSSALVAWVVAYADHYGRAPRPLH